MSVDGVNVVSGETAAHDQTGYVLNHGQLAQITGWRKNLARVAAFEFTALPNSYAARTGRPDNVGVIGVAVFREKRALRAAAGACVTAAIAFEIRSADRRGDAKAPQRVGRRALPPPMMPTRKAIAPSAEISNALGTGHGRSEYAPTQHVAFERAQSTPDELITIHYDSRDNLIAMGAIPQPECAHGIAHPSRSRAPVGFVAGSAAPLVIDACCSSRGC